MLPIKCFIVVNSEWGALIAPWPSPGDPLGTFNGAFAVYHPQRPTLPLTCRTKVLFKSLSWAHSKLQSGLRMSSSGVFVVILGESKVARDFHAGEGFNFYTFSHRHVAFHLLINLELHRLHLLVCKTPLCISLKWPSFYFKTFNCSLFFLLGCPSEHKHSSLEMSDITENFFKSHFLLHTDKEKRKKKRNWYFI